MIDKLEKAKVIMISEKGCYHPIMIAGTDEIAFEICYYAICQYDGAKDFYLFSCTENMDVEGDTTFDTVEDAKKCAEDWAKAPIKWYLHE